MHEIWILHQGLGLSSDQKDTVWTPSNPFYSHNSSNDKGYVQTFKTYAWEKLILRKRSIIWPYTIPIVKKYPSEY